MYADENVIKIKHAVLLEVAKAAFAGNLDEIRDDIPFTLIPMMIPSMVRNERILCDQIPLKDNLIFSSIFNPPC